MAGTPFFKSIAGKMVSGWSGVVPFAKSRPGNLPQTVAPLMPKHTVKNKLP